MDNLMTAKDDLMILEDGLAFLEMSRYQEKQLLPTKYQ